MGSTKVELVADLLGKPASLARDKLIERAKAGVYHDFDSDLAMPKMTLVTALDDAGFHDLSAKVKAGDYDDEEPTLEQEEEMRQHVGSEFYDEVMGKKERGRA